MDIPSREHCIPFLTLGMQLMNDISGEQYSRKSCWPKDNIIIYSTYFNQRPFKIPKWQISLPFHMLQRLKSVPFYISKAWKRYHFRAKPLLIGHYREYPPGGGVLRPQNLLHVISLYIARKIIRHQRTIRKQQTCCGVLNVMDKGQRSSDAPSISNWSYRNQIADIDKPFLVHKNLDLSAFLIRSTDHRRKKNSKAALSVLQQSQYLFSVWHGVHLL